MQQTAPSKLPDQGSATPGKGTSAGGPTDAAAGASALSSDAGKALLQQLIDVLTKLVALMQGQSGASQLGTTPGGGAPAAPGGGAAPGGTPPTGTGTPGAAAAAPAAPAAPAAAAKLTLPADGGSIDAAKTYTVVTPKDTKGGYALSGAEAKGAIAQFAAGTTLTAK